MFGLDVDTLRNIRKTIAQFPHIEKVLIYGSRAKGNYKAGSDIDITLVAEDLTLKNSVYPLSTALDDLHLPYTFDISIFDQLENPDFVDHILRIGKTFYQKENNVRKGWKETTIGDVCELYQPKTISKKEMISDGKYLVFGANGVIGRYNKFNHEEPQLLITCRGATCGSVNISEPQSWITGNAMVVRPKVAELSLRFLEYLFRGSVDFTSVISGAAQPQITRKSLSPVTIFYPPLAEQKRIVAILDEAFAAIATATANIEKNLANAKELFDSELNRVLQPPQPADNSVSDVTAEWRETTLGEVCELYQPKTISKKEMISDGKYLVFGANGVIGRHNKFNHEEPQLLITCRGATCGSVNISEPQSWITGNAMVVRPKVTGLSLRFLEYLFRGSVDLTSVISGAAQPQITRKSLSPVLIFYPPSLSEQKRIATFLDKLSAGKQTLVKTYETKIHSLTELKQSLLHQAFTGELTSK